MSVYFTILASGSGVQTMVHILINAESRVAQRTHYLNCCNINTAYNNPMMSRAIERSDLNAVNLENIKIF